MYISFVLDLCYPQEKRKGKKFLNFIRPVVIIVVVLCISGYFYQPPNKAIIEKLGPSEFIGKDSTGTKINRNVAFFQILDLLMDCLLSWSRCVTVKLNPAGYS